VLFCWLTGLGDLQLAPDFLQHQVKQITWNNMTLDAADAKFKKLMKDNGTLCAKYCGACTRFWCRCKHNKRMFAHNVVGVSTNKTVLSKDGKLTVTGSPRITHKKGQRQQPCAEHTIRPLK